MEKGKSSYVHIDLYSFFFLKLTRQLEAWHYFKCVNKKKTSMSITKRAHHWPCMSTDGKQSKRWWVKKKRCRLLWLRNWLIKDTDLAFVCVRSYPFGVFYLDWRVRGMGAWWGEVSQHMLSSSKANYPNCSNDPESNHENSLIWANYVWTPQFVPLVGQMTSPTFSSY
jgi:hypothetical protein